jgi:hypothetical protein
MGRLTHTRKELQGRWHQKMPRFFYWLVVVASGIGGTAAAINIGIPATGGMLHDWWNDIYPYIFGGCIGVVCVSKLTVAGGYKEVDPDRLLHGRPGGHFTMAHDIDEDIDGEQPWAQE